ncbi:MAG: hypothetical protein ACI9GM_000844 [Salibacteraceae bacterium]|jgi:hypothetical protein
MKLEKLFQNLNSLEKNSFIKIIDLIVSDSNHKNKEVEEMLANSEQSDLKSMDNEVLSKLFGLVKNEFSTVIKSEFVNTSSQLDILIDIISRDGNSIMKRNWLEKLYEEELKNIKLKIKDLESEILDPKSDIAPSRKRDYRIYKACVKMAISNDELNNRESKITSEELSILVTLSNHLGLSQEETKLINYSVLPVSNLGVDTIINELKAIGVVFYSRKHDTVYVADEMVRLLRQIRKKDVADKYLRRILRTFKEPQLNLICRAHNINRTGTYDEKLKRIIDQGVNFSDLLIEDVHKPESKIPEKKKFINDIWSNGLGLSGSLKGVTLEDKVENIIKHFDTIESDEKIGISIDGFEKLLTELYETLPDLKGQIQEEFQLQNSNDPEHLSGHYLLDYNIKPRDILYIIPSTDLNDFIAERGVKKRGISVENIMEAYKDTENLYLENYVNIAFRDLNTLKENGITIKESELGLKFEDLTSSIFTQLGFNVDDTLKKSLNTKKDKMDVLLNLGDGELILIECKTVKESGYNKFSSVSRQMKSYTNLAKLNDYKIIKSLLVAPDFSDDFINETAEEYDLNLSLITAQSLLSILDGFKHAKKHSQFPYKLLMRDVLIKEDRIIKAIMK